MVRLPSTTLLLGFALIASACRSSTYGALPARAGDISSERLDVLMAAVVPLGASEAGLELVLRSKSEVALWVTVTFEAPDPAQRCEAGGRIEPGGSYPFACPQLSLAANRGYPVFIAVRAEHAEAKVLESHRMQLWFSEADAAAFARLRASLRGRERPLRDEPGEAASIRKARS